MKKKANNDKIVPLDGGVDEGGRRRGKMITKRQKKVLELREKGYSFNMISSRLKIHKSRAYQLYKKAIENRKRLGGVDEMRGQSSRGVDDSAYFVHKLHLKIKPYYQYPRYTKYLKGQAKYTKRYKQWTLILYDKVIDVIQRQSQDFTGETTEQALNKAYSSFTRAMRLAGRRYGFEWEKEMLSNVTICDGHIEYGPSGVAKTTEGHIQLIGEDGKVYFVVDRSKGKFHHGYTHPSRHRSDADIIEPYIRDFRDNGPATNTQIGKAIIHTQGQISNLIDLVRSLLPPKPQKAQNGEADPEYIG